MFVAIRPVSRGVLTRQAIRRLAAVRGFCSEGKGEDKKSEGEQKENTSKDVGNPITWANPTGGPTIEDRSPAAWRWVYPVGVGIILFTGFMSGRRARKEKALIEGRGY